MALYGYARVSSSGQVLTVQREALRAAGCQCIREEKASATSRNGRPELATLLEFVRAGDVVVVTRLDRLARSLSDLLAIVEELEANGAGLKATEQNVDTTSAAGRAFLGMIGVFAEFETALRKERQMEGIEKAKAKGVYKGRKPSIDPEEVRAMKTEGLGASAIAKRLGVARSSVYRVLEER